MDLNQLPASLRPIIQNGFLTGEFKHGLEVNRNFRHCADRVRLVGELDVKVNATRPGLGMTATNTPATIEHYQTTLRAHTASEPLVATTGSVGLAAKVLQNAYTHGEHAARVIDERCCTALYRAHLSGNTEVRRTLRGPSTTVAVDDVCGFEHCFVGGRLCTVSAEHPLTVLIDGTRYIAVGVDRDAVNVTKRPHGHSGHLHLRTDVFPLHGTTGRAVIAANAAHIMRPGAKRTTSELTAEDTLKLRQIQETVRELRTNAVPDIQGVYNCYLDPISLRQVCEDPEFRKLYKDPAVLRTLSRASNVVTERLGVRFVTTAEHFVQHHPLHPESLIRRPMICGQGAVIEIDLEGPVVASGDPRIDLVDGVAMVTHNPDGAATSTITQSWYWLGGVAVPKDVTSVAHTLTIPSARNAIHKRAIIIEHYG